MILRGGLWGGAGGLFTARPWYDANIAGNWYFIFAMTVLFLPIIWLVTDRIIEPRLGTWSPAAAGEQDAGTDKAASDPDAPAAAAEKSGLRWAGLASLAVVALWVFMAVGPDTPLIDETACPDAELAAGATARCKRASRHSTARSSPPSFCSFSPPAGRTARPRARSPHIATSSR